ncbi:unnamed protein product [Brassica oleracea var. botrytis]|uniref:(rape) hypothetical protein n=1 Tax=Brassica napus TaxID=3708 RepID=A0A816LXZ6_BRANA|nr:unnamed protein product [Brassica napus]
MAFISLLSPQDRADSASWIMDGKVKQSRRAPIHHLLSTLSSSVQDGVDVRSRLPVVVALRRVSLTSASPRLKPMTAPSRVVLSAFAAVGINSHRCVSAPSLPARHHPMGQGNKNKKDTCPIYLDNQKPESCQDKPACLSACKKKTEGSGMQEITTGCISGNKCACYVPCPK